MMSAGNLPCKLPSFSDIDTSGMEIPEDHISIGELQLPSFDLKDIINEDDTLSNTDYMNNNIGEPRKEFLKPYPVQQVNKQQQSVTLLDTKERQDERNSSFKTVRIPKLIQKMKRKEMKESLKVRSSFLLLSASNSTKLLF